MTGCPDDYRVCHPRGAVLYDAVLIVVSHIEAQPERLHENFNALAMEALSRAWPCPYTSLLNETDP